MAQETDRTGCRTSDRFPTKDFDATKAEFVEFFRAIPYLEGIVDKDKTVREFDIVFPMFDRAAHATISLAPQLDILFKLDHIGPEQSPSFLRLSVNTGIEMSFSGACTMTSVEVRAHMALLDLAKYFRTLVERVCIPRAKRKYSVECIDNSEKPAWSFFELFKDLDEAHRFARTYFTAHEKDAHVMIKTEIVGSEWVWGPDPKNPGLIWKDGDFLYDKERIGR